MTTTGSLSTLLERSEAQRDAVLAALQRADDLRRRHQAQLQQIDAYRAQHHQRWSAQFGRTHGGTEIVQCYRDFTLRLDEAMQQQQAQVDAAGAQCARLRDQLVAAELRVASVGKLIQRRQAEVRHASARREQRQSDESAQRARWRSTDAAPLMS
jgi:flagellar protein FliJ